MEYHTTCATYYVDNLKLSMLLLEIVEEAIRNISNLSKIHLLTYVLSHIPFMQKEQEVKIINTMSRCENFMELRGILEIDYEIDGSFIIFEDGETEWYLDISILLPN